jgi:hypothetical protein
MSRKWKKRIAIGAACLGVLAVGGLAAGRYAQGAALRGFTDGRPQRRRLSLGQRRIRSIPSRRLRRIRQPHPLGGSDSHSSP